MYKEGFASKLKKARENTGFSQREIATEIGVIHTTISKYENGLLEPDIEKLGLLSDFYGVSIDWLVGTSFGQKEYTDKHNLKNKKEKRQRTIQIGIYNERE